MNAWSREDIVVAFALYCVTPLNKINPSNKVIQQVAEIIPHSVASIVMRMRNFQFIDPKVSSGLKNRSTDLRGVQARLGRVEP